MRNLMPQFIQEHYLAGNEQGQFPAATLFVDISGFTPLTVTLMEFGNEGAEILAHILRDVFGEMVQAIYRQGGFVSGFAGDALTAIFPLKESPQKTAIQALNAAQAIHTIFKTKGERTLRFGTFNLYVKIGLDQGMVNWGIVGSDTHKAWFFRGPAIDGCAQAEHHCEPMDVVLTDQIAPLVNELADCAADDRPYLRLQTISPLTNDPPAVEVRPIQREVARLFLPNAVLDYSRSGDFRYVASVFVSFQEPRKFATLSTLVGQLIELCDRYDGYMEKIDFGDKGGNALVVFGAPIAHENTVDRALHFITDLQKIMGVRVRIGATYGPVFAGIGGGAERAVYSMLGNTVNLSARLMLKATWGEAWVEHSIADRAGSAFELDALGAYQFKGFSEPHAVYNLKGLTAVTKANIYRQAMVGRTAELQRLLDFVQPLHTVSDDEPANNSPVPPVFPGALVVYGTAGMGKSRLVYELRQQLRQEDRVNWCYFPCDNIRGGAFHPIRYFLFSLFRQSRELGVTKNRERFDAELNRLITELAAYPASDHVQTVLKEVDRTRSVLAGLLNLHEKGSLYGRLEPRQRYDNTILAIINLFEALTLMKPVLISFDDLQWIDSESRTVVRLLARHFQLTTDQRQTAENDPAEPYRYPLALLFTSRYYDDGTRPTVDLDDGIPLHTVALDVLDRGQIQALARQVVQTPLSPQTLEFLQQRTAGNPFYVEHLLLDLKNRAAFDVSPKDGTLIVPLAQKEAIPPTINDLLIARLDRLARRVKELVQTAAVIGHEFKSDFLLTIMRRFDPEYPVEEVSYNLETAREEQIWEALQEINYMFRHALLREAAYNMQLRSHLRALHRIIAETMAELAADDPTNYADIARHYDRGEVVPRAIEFLEKAGRYAKENYQNEDALAFYDRLLELHQTSSNESDPIAKTFQMEIVSSKLGLMDLLGQWTEALELSSYYLDKAEEEEEDRLEIAHWKNTKSLYLNKLQEHKACLSLAHDVLELTENFSGWKAQSTHIGALRTIGVSHAQQGQLEAALLNFQKCKDISEAHGYLNGYSMAIGNLGVTYWQLGQLDRALDCALEEKHLADLTGILYDQAFALGNIGNIYLVQGRFQEARKYCEQKMEICKTIGDRAEYGQAVGNLGVIYNETGDLEQALVYYKEKQHICELLGDRLEYAIAENNMGNIYLQKEAHEEALSHYTASIRSQNEIELIIPETRYKVALCFADVDLNNYPELHDLTGLELTADTWFEFSIAEATRQQTIHQLTPALYEYGRYLYQTGRESDGYRHLQEAQEKARSAGLEPDLKEIEEICRELNISLLSA